MPLGLGAGWAILLSVAIETIISSSLHMWKSRLGTDGKTSYLTVHHWFCDVANPKSPLSSPGGLGQGLVNWYEIWHSCFNALFRGIINISLIETKRKVLTWWYLVPTHLAKMYASSSLSVLSWILHEEYYVSYLVGVSPDQGVLEQVFFLLCQVLDEAVDQQLQYGLLNEAILDIPHSAQRLAFFIFLAAKCTIAGACKKSFFFFTYNKHKISWIMIHEKLACGLLDKVKSFVRTWSPWASYMHIQLEEWILFLFYGFGEP